MKVRGKRVMGWAATWLLALTTCAGNGSSASADAELADAEVARHMGAYYSALVGRQLTRAELRELTEQCVRLGTSAGQSIEEIRAVARGFDPGTEMLRAGGPAAQTQRDWMLKENYFRPALQGTIETRLMSEADPVRVVDRRRRLALTEADIVALANLRDFARSSAAPQHRELSRDELEKAVKKLDSRVGGDGKMPLFFHEAAAFWTGVRQEWPALSAEQQQLTRAYAEKTWRIQLPPELYQRLWGLPPEAVFRRQAGDVSERISFITTLNVEFGNLPILLDQIFPP